MMLPLPSISTLRAYGADDDEHQRIPNPVLKGANSSAALLGNFRRAPKGPVPRTLQQSLEEGL